MWPLSAAIRRSFMILMKAVSAFSAVIGSEAQKLQNFVHLHQRVGGIWGAEEMVDSLEEPPRVVLLVVEKSGVV